MYASDKQGGVPRPPNLLEGFRTTIEDCQLSEIDMFGGKFTWERSRGSDAWVREKLDRVFATLNWWGKFPLCHLKVLHTVVSDHEPLFLELVRVDIPKKTFRFRFENMWLREPSFIEDVTATWKSLPRSHLLPKLFAVSSFMARWGKSFFHKFREKLKLHKLNLSRLVDCTDEASVQEYLRERDKLNELLLQEEIYWKQRAKLHWLKEGDENTRFFHSYASTRKRINKITYLVGEDGVRVEDQEGMSEVVRDYFTRLFTGDVEEGALVYEQGVRTVSRNQNLKLVEEFSFDEFITAVKQMHPDKSAGPDGLNPTFFQKFWSLMGVDVYEYCKSWLESSVLPGELNSTNVVLIPKKEDANCMKELIPIALCNVLYKIVAKVLANRL